MKNLRLLRESHKMSQQKLADELNLSQSQIQNYEAGAYEPDIATLKMMADFFDTSVDFLIGRTDNSQGNGPYTEYSLNEAEKNFVDRFRMCSPKQRHILSIFLDALECE